MKDHYKSYRSTKFILLATIIALFFCNAVALANTSNRNSRVNTYFDKKYGFSFSIPAYLKITPSSDESYYNCKAVTPDARKKYAANKGYIFTMEISKLTLDSTLSIYGYDKRANGDYYFNTPTDDSLKANKISGNGWTGLQEVHVCRGESIVKSNGDVISELLDGCENIYLSNGKITIKIYTDGVKLDDKLYSGILKSLRF
ncbi:hypothetical protein [Mucilaginibacter sp. L196]|jgi:hypothetical protein|uniref:hypothetical protein n=1 Tax=Mucilaginibacter sp. L196 TaxID=1641870 RepID=UPI00131BEDC6|nr:hypothetical protein [Mucilaginibacter sp. L196]